MTEETFERTFEVSKTAQLNVSNIRGSVDVQAAEDGQIKILAVKHLGTGDADRTRIEMDQKSDGRVVVATHYGQPRDLLWNIGLRPCRVDYTVLVPPSCSVHVNTVSSRAELKGLEGEVVVKSVSGGVTLQDIKGEVTLEVVSASALLTRIIGPLAIKAVSGDVKLLESNSASIRASTVSGDLNLETPIGDGPYAFHSVSGDLRVTVPADTGCCVRMASISGDIRTNLPVSTLSRQLGYRVAEIQGGGVIVNVDTISGNFTIQQTGQVEKTFGSSKSTQERHEVLERLSNGEITAEEALGQL